MEATKRISMTSPSMGQSFAAFVLCAMVALYNTVHPHMTVALRVPQSIETFDVILGIVVKLIVAVAGITTTTQFVFKYKERLRKIWRNNWMIKKTRHAWYGLTEGDKVLLGVTIGILIICILIAIK